MQWCNKLDDAVQRIAETTGEVKDTIVETAEEMKDAIIETATEIKETATKIWDAINIWN